MPVTELDGHQIHVDADGYLTQYDEWTEDLGRELAAQIGVELTEAHWRVIRFLREDYLTQGETATTRRVQVVGGVPVKDQFALFPKKPGKKIAYIAGLPKPHGCV